MTTNKSTGNTGLLTKRADRELVMERVFDAPRDLVYKAYTDPKLIPQWWGPKRMTTTVERMDVRPGGAWRYVQRDPDGRTYAFHGEFREVVAPERLSSTFIFEGTPSGEAVDTVTFVDRGGKTRLTITSRFQSAEDRDEILDSGMEAGAAESMERLAALLRTMK